ncbi:MAG: hypothetical protein AAGA99_00480 [Actinomycetota bacterium]
MTYARTAHQRGTDRERGQRLETYVRDHLGDFLVDNSESTQRLDFWVPGFYTEVKGKYQEIGDRWMKHWPALAEPNAFILDELSVRKALDKWPHAYFVLVDAVHEGQERWFLASVAEVACADRARLNRKTQRVFKGKWILNLAQFTELDASLTGLRERVMADITDLPWKRSDCLVAAASV